MIVASFFAPRFDKWGCDYDALLRLVDASCRRVGLRHVVISDSERPAPLETARFDLPENLMQACLDGQRRFLEASAGPVLLIGADCLVTRNFNGAIGHDMAITIGPFSDCEMNTGAIWCADGPSCAPVWQTALDRGPLEWGEDQVALYAAVQDAEAKGLNIRRLRCERYNWAPESVADPAGLPTVVHFRGRRKAWAAEWAARFLDIRA